jgi:hypothetical protein
MSFPVRSFQALAAIGTLFLGGCANGSLLPIPIATPHATAPPAAPLALSATTLSFTSAMQAQSLTISDGTPGPYTSSGCAGIVTAAVTGTTVTLTATGSGTCTLTVTDSAGSKADVAITVTTLTLPVQ